MQVYKITNLVNGKVYIGKWQGRSVERRWQIHLQTAASGRGFYLHNAIRKHGADAFKIEVLATANSKEELAELERRLIAEHKATDPQIGYNLAKGGEGGFSYPGERNSFYGKHHTEETKKILRKKCPRSGWTHSEDTKKRISCSHAGKKFTEEHRQHLSLAKQGTKLSAERKQQISEFFKGIPRNEMWKQRISTALTGRKFSVEHRQRLSMSRSKPKIAILCAMCPVSFQAKASSHRKFCSRSCYYASQRSRS